MSLGFAYSPCDFYNAPMEINEYYRCKFVNKNWIPSTAIKIDHIFGVYTQNLHIY